LVQSVIEIARDALFADALLLLGIADISGRLPITIPPALRLGDGEQKAARAPR